MKYLLLLVVIAVAVWMITARNRSAGRPADKASRRTKEPAAKAGPTPAPTPMLACAHCGVHLPQAEAVLDAAGKPFCSEAHRLAGPR